MPPSLPEVYNVIMPVNRKARLGVTHKAYLVSQLSCPLVFRYFEYFVATLARPSTRSPFVTLLSRRGSPNHIYVYIHILFSVGDRSNIAGNFVTEIVKQKVTPEK